MKKITKDLKISGIYCIINIKNSKKYIGSSKNIRQRLWSHRAELRHNKHENSHLQNAWNKYGEHNFDYYILEKCRESLLLEKEQFYIDTINPEYNMNKETQRPPCTEESRMKQSNTRKKLYAEGKLKPSFKHITTYVYDLDGNFIKEYSSMKDAAIGEFRKNTGAVRSACYGIQNPSHRVHDRRFYLEKLEELPIIEKQTNSRPSVIVKVDSEDEHLEFLGWKAAASYFNVSIYNLMQYKNKNLKFKKKYMITTTLPCN
jgi:group I intron endonuclease